MYSIIKLSYRRLQDEASFSANFVPDITLRDMKNLLPDSKENGNGRENDRDPASPGMDTILITVTRRLTIINSEIVSATSHLGRGRYRDIQ